MENKAHEYDKISLQEIIEVLWKNKYFITTFLSVGLLLGLFFSGIKVLQKPVEYRYEGMATIELVDGSDMQNQPQTMLHVMESSSILEASMNKLMINNGDYVVRTAASNNPDQYDVIVEGPDSEIVVSLVNEVVAKALAIATPSMPMGRNAVIDNGYVLGNPIKISKDINMTYNIMISIILAGMISVFIIFVTRSMSRRVYNKGDVERILDVKVLANIPHNGDNSKYKRFFRVR